MKIKSFIYFVFLSGLFLVFPKLLQAGNLPVKTYTSADGLGSSFINSMRRDSRGFMWFATRDGLSRFDGRDFTTYQIGKIDDAPGVEEIYESENGVYWITTTGGTFRFDSNAAGEAKIINDAEKKILDAQFVTDARSVVYKDKAGRTWMGGNVPSLIKEANGKFSFEEIAFNYPNAEWRKYPVVDFFETADESLWMVTLYGLMRRLTDGRAAFYHFGENEKADLRYALPDAAGRIWLSFSNSVEVLQPESVSELAAGENVIVKTFPLFKNQKSSPEIFLLPTVGGQISRFALADADEVFRQIYESSDRHIWIGASNSVIEFDGQNRRRYDAEQGLTTQIPLVCEDAGGNLWFGGQNGATRLNRFGMESFSAADGLNSRMIQSLYERNGVVYAVNGNGYLSRFNGATFETVRPKFDENAAFSWLSSFAFPDSFGEWWILTQNKLYRFARPREFADLENQKPSAIYTTADGLKSDAIFRLFEDSHGDLWISTRGQDNLTKGLTHWSRTNEKFRAFGENDNFPAGKSPVSFAENADGTLWFGFYEGGLIRYKDGVFTEIKEDLSKGFFAQILFDRQNRLWLASAQSGVTRFDEPQNLTRISARFTTENGLSSNNARSLVEAANGDVYIGTARGVDRLANDSGEIRHYSIADGLSGDFVGSSLAELNGALWFGTPNGLSRFAPKNSDKNSAPPVWIGNLRVTGENRFVPQLGAQEISNLELAANQNNLQIDFFAVNFASGDDPRYQYKLAGADTDWSEPTATRTINFANLVAGEYQFAVRTVNADGIPGEKPATVSFSIAPPVYRRWWFLTLAGLLIAAGIFALDRFRVKKTRQVENALEISRESAERFRTLAQTASDAIITVNKESRIVFVNDAAEKIFGYTETELLGADLKILMPDALRTAHDAGMARYIETGEKHISWAVIELPGKHKTGREIPLELSFGEFSSGGKRFFTGIARDISERKKTEENLQRAAEIEQKSKTDRLRELEQVRRRIAADLHDDIGSSLTQISIFSEVLQQRIDKSNERVLEPLEFIAGSSRELVDAMSDIVWAINPQKDSLSELTGKMRRFAADVFSAKNIRLKYEVFLPEVDLALGANLRREVFLIFKESVNNIVKHSKCTAAEIELIVENAEIRLKLHDDGAGFNVDKTTDGHGLVSMKQRAAGLNGKLEIVSNAKDGTTTTLQVPLGANAGEND